MKNNSAILFDTLSGQWFHFKEPITVLIAHSVQEVLPLLREAENAVSQKGLHAAGFVSYEASPAFDQALTTHVPGDFPLAWFGIYKTVLSSPRKKPLSCAPLPDLTLFSLSYEEREEKGRGKSLEHASFRGEVTPEQYQKAFSKIKEHIRNGDTYQVNYTFRMLAETSCRFENAFLNLAMGGHGKYPCFIETDDFTVCSFSPELFFKLQGDRINCRPMKGTIKRGRFLEEDRQFISWLKNSAKDRAENIMITDMIRNDLGRVCRPGTLSVDDLCAIEKYDTLFQMVSAVSGSTNASIPEIFIALFPCASVTGAPKASTMKIIDDLEQSPRNIYTGAIGYWGPNRQAQFNVAIRTILYDKKTGIVAYGTGGGIVWDSDPEKEFQEALAKTRVLFSATPDFSLLETMLWTRDNGYYLLEYHLKRLMASVEYFGFAITEKQVSEYLKNVSSKIAFEQCRVRFLASRAGEMRHEVFPLDATAVLSPVKLRMATTGVHSRNRFLFHKTDWRDLYEQAKVACPDCDDVVLFNENNEITETTIANLVVRIDGTLCTPPISCGLLPGVFRQHLLDNGEIIERTILLQEFAQSEKIFRINSVRTWERCVLL